MNYEPSAMNGLTGQRSALDLAVEGDLFEHLVELPLCHGPLILQPSTFRAKHSETILLFLELANITES